MNTGITALAVAGILALAASPALAATTIRVPQDQATIQDAANAAAAGDTILVARGLYREQVNVAGKNDLSFIGKKAVWTGNVNGVQGSALTATGDRILVQGFTFRHGGGHVHITGVDAVVTRCTSEGGERDDQEFSFVRIDGNGARVDKCKIRDAAEPAIHVFGDSANVSRNKFGLVRDMGIAVEGNDAVVEKNKFEHCKVMAVNVEGAGAIVRLNKIAYAGVMGIHITGDGLVEKNRVSSGPGVAGICVDHDNATGSKILKNKLQKVLGVGIRSEVDGVGNGSGAEIVGNKVDFPNKDGIQVETAGSTVSSNKVKFGGLCGLYVLAAGADVRGNKVTSSGNGCLAAFEVVGDGNTLTDNKAIKHRGDGFYVAGSGNTLTSCLAKLCTEDGFDVQSGANNELSNCTGGKNGAEGLDNSATNTDVSGGSFSGNRIDVVNDGTFANLGATFSTGGDTEAPQVDCVDGERGDRW